jgi:nitrate/nitrite transport system substrate-binding protein
MRRWGQIAEPKPDAWYAETAKSVYRPDVYRAAAEALIAEGKMKASDFPDFAKETGYRPPQSEFIDGITYDGTKPNEYLGKFAIGLKAEEVVQ